MRAWPHGPVGRNRAFLAAGMLIVLVLAGIVSSFASTSPDGLESVTLRGCTVDAEGRITGGSCPAQHEKRNQTADGILAEYGVRGVDDTHLSTGLAGVIGVLITFGVGSGVVWLARRRSKAARDRVTP